MPHTMLRPPDSARVIARLNEIAGHLQHCEDLSALVIFVADMAGREESAPSLVSDAAACARVWRGVAAVHQQLQECLAAVQTATEELHDVTTRSLSGAP
jgi:hypothetical protein